MFGIHLDDDGLLMHGPRLTWMDAAVGRRRDYAESRQSRGNPSVMVQHPANHGAVRKNFEDPVLAEKYGAMAEQTRKSFNEKFWNPQNGCLFDVVDD